MFYIVSSGGWAAGVPGEVAGLWRQHELHGTLTWKELIDPIIKICEDGYEATSANAGAIESNEDKIRDKENYNLW